MPRTLSSALQTELARTITSVGYLVQIALASGTKRLSNIGTVTWNALTWTEEDFSVEGLDFNADAELTARFVWQNLDGVAGRLVLAASEHLYSVPVTIYQFAYGALGTLGVPLIATMAIDSCEVTPDKVALALTDANTDAQFSPRRRIGPSDGFSFATPANTVITWGNEIFTVEPSDG